MAFRNDTVFRDRPAENARSVGFSGGIRGQPEEYRARVYVSMIFRHDGTVLNQLQFSKEPRLLCNRGSWAFQVTLDMKSRLPLRSARAVYGGSHRSLL